jgi:hypothetical protein
MKLDPQNRQRVLVIAAAAGVGLLVLDRIVLMPLLAHWQQRSAQIVQLGKDVARGRSAIERAAFTESRWQEMQSQALPKEPAQAEQDLISAFDRWGRANTIELASIKPQWKRGTGDRHSLLECRVDASGTLGALARFLFEVEKSPMALRIESVELTARDNNGQRLGLSLLVSGLRFAPLERKS